MASRHDGAPESDELLRYPLDLGCHVYPRASSTNSIMSLTTILFSASNTAAFICASLTLFFR